ncbi:MULTISPECIES: ATP-binding cassette domain-containing protein [Microterricola]|uniref:ABC transporter n=2 Tax=Microterricola TaxID=518733 RepID=A0A1H1VMY8_9MICO|nr:MULTISPECIES: dipeptide/oligopeptide/nickel ABC transporter ATP-binding protein [Microterricola]PPL14229.1 hypothetical protein GY24_16845 [Microterricola pindariensis]SDS85419.1 ABC transporter [Microterricola viridarii]
MAGTVAHGYPIATSDLTIEYPPHGASPAHVAVRGLSLRVAPGEVLGLLGESGSGKSTVARVLSAAFVDPGPELRPVITGGDALLFGVSLRGLSRRKAAKLSFNVGFLAQDAGSTLDSGSTVAELVAEPVLRREKHFDRRELEGMVVTMIDAVRLPLSILSKFPYELSSGQRQRVALARALILEPTLLIADEPTAGVDVTVRAAISELFAELQRDRAFTALVISHDVAVLRAVADRIAVLQQGVLVGLGTIDEVFDDPSHPYVARLAESFHDVD